MAIAVIKRLVSIPEAGIFAALLILIVFFQTINPAFMSPGNVAGLLRAMSITGIVAIGLALCLLAGTIDISVGSIVGVTSIVFARAAAAGWPMLAAVLLAVACGCLAGYFNSLIIVRLHVSAFITTISTLYVFRGLAYFLTHGLSVYPLPPEVTAFGLLQPLGVSWSFIIMLVLLVVMSLVLSYTVWGMCVRATGSNLEVAVCNEVDVVAIQTSVLTLSGGLAGLAGALVTTTIGSGQPTVGSGWELIAIVGCTIGGISLFGYFGSMLGLFFGLLVVQVITNGMIVIGIPPFASGIVLGVILVASMIIDVIRRRGFNVEIS